MSVCSPIYAGFRIQSIISLMHHNQNPDHNFQTVNIPVISYGSSDDIMYSHYLLKDMNTNMRSLFARERHISRTTPHRFIYLNHLLIVKTGIASISYI